jgi:hypothetical protein
MKELCIKLVIKTSLYYDARSEKHRIIISRKYLVTHEDVCYITYNIIGLIQITY